MNKNEIRISDVLYEPSIMYKKVVEHKIVDMYLEKYVSGWGAIVVTESYLGRSPHFASDVTHWCLTKEEAEHEFMKRMHKVDPWK